MSSTLQNIIAVLGIVILGVLGYYLYTQNGSILSGTSVSDTNTEAAAQAAEFLARLNELENIRLDDSLFNDPRFRSLESVRQPVVPVPVGRTNPFADSN